MEGCRNGHVYKLPVYVTAVSGITCALSIIGAAAIIFSYLCFKNLRNRTREIIVHISLMDFVVAASNLIGIAADFTGRLSPPYNGEDSVRKTVYLPSSDRPVINNLCIAQAAFAQYSTVSSILWTIAIAVYFYLRITLDDARLAKQSIYGFYVVCYGLPLLLTLWFGISGKIGYSPVGGSGWCSIVIDDINAPQSEFDLFFGSNFWIYLTLIIVPAIAISLIAQIKLKVKSEIMSHEKKAAINNAEVKLMAIPIVFVLLRIWSLLLLFVLRFQSTSCGLIIFLLIMGGIGDSGQGVFNAIIFCLFNKKVRRAYVGSFRRWKSRRWRYMRSVTAPSAVESEPIASDHDDVS